MKKGNLNIMFAFAAAIVFPGVTEAANSPVMAPQQAMAAKTGGSGAPALEPFGNYYGAGPGEVSYMEQGSAPGLVKEKGPELPSRGRFKGFDCYKNGGFSKAPGLKSPRTVISNSGLKAPEVLSSIAPGMKKKGEGTEKPAARREKRVSRLREPGEALGGGKERRAEEDAKKMAVQKRLVDAGN
jgi:hypothetical protein